MSAISETYNSTHNILELDDVLPNVSFTAHVILSQQVKWKVIITSKTGKYELT